jgi:hypothetical protein
MTQFYIKSAGFTIAVALCLTFISDQPAWAGEPDKTIGGINPNHYACVDSNDNIVDLDNDAFEGDGDTATFDEDIEVDLDDLKGECKDAEDDLDEDLTVTLIRQSRVEGYVVEFHQDPSAPTGWQGVFSRDVPVVISGPGFEVFKGSEKDGSYYFDKLGAGPVTFNLRLPADAHALNPNVTVITTGFYNTTSGIYLGFYRGDMSPPDITIVGAPDGVPLPPANFTFDLEDSDGDSLSDLTGMPSVGGVLPPQQPFYIIALAIILLVILPLAGVLKLRRNR